MSAVKARVAELEGVALDWAVAQIEGYTPDSYMRNVVICTDAAGKPCQIQVAINRMYVAYSPSTNWQQGGDIIQRACIRVSPNIGGSWHGHIHHEKGHPLVEGLVFGGFTNQHGPTPLIAAMRCLVAAALGVEIEVPQELLP